MMGGVMDVGALRSRLAAVMGEREMLNRSG